MQIIRGLRIPADEEASVELVELQHGNVQAIEYYVGGYFQVVDIERPDASIFCDEDAKVKGSPLNRRATLLWWVHYTAARQVDVLNGDVLILGLPDDEGETRGVPDDLVDLLMRYKEWKYEVKVIGEDGWHGNQVTFTDVWKAYNDALALAERWTKVEVVRVVPHVTELNPL